MAPYWIFGRAWETAPWANWCVFALALALTALSTERHGSYAAADPGEVVLDELLGMWVLLLVAAPASPLEVLALLVMFRALDIFKPPPFSWMDRRIKGRYGYLADDLAIGVILGLAFLVLSATRG